MTATAAGSTPICSSSNTCIACTAVGTNAQDDMACEEKIDGTLLCVSGGATNAGECRACDPNNDDGCSVHLISAASADFTCVDCIGASRCAANRVCLDGGSTCVECND